MIILEIGIKIDSKGESIRAESRKRKKKVI